MNLPIIIFAIHVYINNLHKSSFISSTHIMILTASLLYYRKNVCIFCYIIIFMYLLQFLAHLWGAYSQCDNASKFEKF